ncbi:MAG TPA: tetratricopeptide repeat protein [Blastocatellia bacterium]|nr:tetratricopeptide repeat protein [Blastocatellia bacterium]
MHNRTVFRRTLLTLVLILSVIASARAQGMHTLQGKVQLPNGAPPTRPVRVMLTFNGMRVYETFTDLSGGFSFSGLHGGTYQLTAEGDGENFETTRVNAEILATGSPQTFTQNVPLRAKAGKSLPLNSTASVDASDVDVPASARQAYEKGVKRAAGDEPEKALKLFQEALTLHPPFYSAQVAMADQLTKLKRDDEAAAAYQKAIELKPERAAAYVGLGVMRVKQQRYADALAPLRRSLEIDKQSSAPYLFLGLAEMMTGDLAAAEQHLLRAYEIGKPMLARLYLASLYEKQSDPTRAIQQLQAVLKENPNLPEARAADIRSAIDKLRRQAGAKK